MIEQSEKLNLSDAMELFEDHLDEVADALALNMVDKIETLPPVPDDEVTRWVWEGVRELQVEKITTIPLQVIKRIQSRKYYMEIPHHEQTDRITPEDIQRAKDTPIEELYDGQLRQSGGKLWGLCPFHGPEKTPSFCLFKDNRYKCFGCQASGDSIAFIMKNNGVQFIEAIRILCR